jgi:hypothetical protein
MVAAKANCVFKRPQLNFFAASIEAEKLEALAVNKSKVWLWPRKKTLRRARRGLDPNLGGRDLDHLAIADQQPGGTGKSSPWVQPSELRHQPRRWREMSAVRAWRPPIGRP